MSGILPGFLVLCNLLLTRIWVKVIRGTIFENLIEFTNFSVRMPILQRF